MSVGTFGVDSEKNGGWQFSAQYDFNHYCNVLFNFRNYSVLSIFDILFSGFD